MKSEDEGGGSSLSGKLFLQAAFRKGEETSICFNSFYSTYLWKDDRSHVCFVCTLLHTYMVRHIWELPGKPWALLVTGLELSFRLPATELFHWSG